MFPKVGYLRRRNPVQGIKIDDGVVRVIAQLDQHGNLQTIHSSTRPLMPIIDTTAPIQFPLRPANHIREQHVAENRLLKPEMPFPRLPTVDRIFDPSSIFSIPNLLNC
jgi:hypothetical protein